VVDRNVSDVETVVLRAVRQAAKRSHTVQRGFVDLDDLIQEGYLYVLENQEKVNGWIDSGDVLLVKDVLYKAMHRYTMRQRYLKDGTKAEDYYVYQFAVLEELLPDAMNDSPNYGSSASDLNTQVKSGKSLAESGDRMAMIADVKAALLVLNDYERELIFRKFYGGGATDNELAQWFEKPEPTINKHVRAALRKMARRLGSEPVTRRRAMSNAQAQHITREQE
jgi:DNA-directed RNA polymerase specialized sigma24 family protein